MLVCSFLTGGLNMPRYLICPHALAGSNLNATELMVYMLILDRCRLSALHEGWQDSMGRVFCIYPVHELAVASGRGETAVKNALRRLEELGLLRRERRGLGKPDRLFVRVPWGGGPPVRGFWDEEEAPGQEEEDQPEAGDAAGGNPSLKGTEGRISVSPEGRESVSLERRISVSQTGGNPPPNKTTLEKLRRKGREQRARARAKAPSFLPAESA